MSVTHSIAKKGFDRSQGAGMNQLVDEFGRPTWKNGPDDPFADLVIDPDKTDEAQEYARQLYQSIRSNNRQASAGILLIAAITIGLWMLPINGGAGWNAAIKLGAVLVACLLITQILKASSASARARRDAVQWQPWARSSLPLSGYLVTTNDPRRLWEAAGHQATRDVVQKGIVHLHQYRASDLLTPSREEELNGYLERDDELRATIVELCDPEAGKVR